MQLIKVIGKIFRSTEDGKSASDKAYPTSLVCPACRQPYQWDGPPSEADDHALCPGCMSTLTAEQIKAVQESRKKSLDELKHLAEQVLKERRRHKRARQKAAG